MGISIKGKIVFIFLLVIILLIVCNYSCVFFSKNLTENDVVNLKLGYLENFGQKHYYCYVGVSNLCRCNPDQYVSFLENISRGIIDTSRYGIDIYYINYEGDKNIVSLLKDCAPYKLEEDYEEYLILNQLWDKKGKLEWQHWYIDGLKHRNESFDEIRDGGYNYDSIQIINR